MRSNKMMSTDNVFMSSGVTDSVVLNANTITYKCD